MTTDNCRRRQGRERSSRAKDEVRALLDRLPDNVTLEDIQYHLDVVREGAGGRGRASTAGIPHEEVMKQFEENGSRE